MCSRTSGGVHVRLSPCTPEPAWASPHLAPLPLVLLLWLTSISSMALLNGLGVAGVCPGKRVQKRMPLPSPQSR